jgi:hypothetical protein
MVIKGVIAHQFKAYSTFKIYFEGTVDHPIFLSIYLFTSILLKQ